MEKPSRDGLQSSRRLHFHAARIAMKLKDGSIFPLSLAR
jgi:hypothetical protein